MAKKNPNHCVGCGEPFVSDVRNRGRQKSCAKSACRAAAKALRQRRWRSKPENQDYFRGPQAVERVREWRAVHPGYWRSHRRKTRRALQDAQTAQVLDQSEHSDPEASGALQDALQMQGPVLIGLIAHLSHSALQEDIAATSRRLLQQGQQILARSCSHAVAKTSVAP